MALATADDVKPIYKRQTGLDLPDDEIAALDEPLEEASDLVTGYLWPSEVPAPTPGPITRVVAAMVVEVLTRSTKILPETTQLTADGFGVRFEPGSKSPGPYLSGPQKQRLRPYKDCSGSVQLVSERYCPPVDLGS